MNQPSVFLLEGWNGDTWCLLGIFKTKDAAVEEKQTIAKKKMYADELFEIKEHEVKE